MIRGMNALFGQLTGLSGSKLHLMTGMALSLAAMLVLPVIGWAADRLERLALNFIARHWGREWALLFCSWLTFPGVVIHELSHALAAIITGARITKMALFKPSRDGTLGYVNIATKGKRSRQGLQMAAVSCAPVVSGMLWLNLIGRVLRGYEVHWTTAAFLIYLWICVMCHMSMSGADLKAYRKGCFYLLAPMTAFMFLAAYFTGA